MNILKIVIGVVLLALVSSIPFFGLAVLDYLGLPLPMFVIVILGFALGIGGIKLLIDGLREA